MLAAASLMLASLPQPGSRPRARELGVVIGRLEPGPNNAITDVAGVRVGHVTVRDAERERICTGVTVVLPHGGNVFRSKVPAAVVVGNGFGKLVGVTQIEELGELESPIALTNTLSVWRVADALVGWLLERPGNEHVRSVNVVVGETNDGRLNDIRARAITGQHVREALANARAGPVPLGAVGAGAGTVCFGFKGGIGSASRKAAGHVVGVLVQSNFGGELTIAGIPVQRALGPPRDLRGARDGSCMIVVATDAPLDARGCKRLARRALAGMARTGASFSNGSGDYVIAFSTAPKVRIEAGEGPVRSTAVLRDEAMTPLFRAVAEATEEAIVDSLFCAVETKSNGRTVPALPVERVLELLRGRRR